MEKNVNQIFTDYAKLKLSKYRLLNNVTQYGWKRFGEYDYGDWDEIYTDGHSERIKKNKYKYTITFSRIPNGKKRGKILSLNFDDFANYAGITGDGFSKEELKAYEEEALTWLITNFVIEPV